ncbi:MAG: hypothetical protein KDB21_19110 [Acidimicrobiales bacterium]|nr:hypothetical protein [Acidimicrobiales bacterium]
MASRDQEQVAKDQGVPIEGGRLTDTGDRTAAIWLLLVVAVGVAIAAVLFAAVGGPAGAIALAVTAAVGIFAYRRARVWAHWENPQLYFPSSSSLRLGEDIVVRFRRRARRSGGAEGSSLTAKLVCTEWVQYRVGTDTHTVTETVLDRELTVTPHHTADLMDCDLRVQVPVFDAPPSMRLPDNRVQWKIVVNIVSPGIPDDDSTFTVAVLPEVVL